MGKIIFKVTLLICFFSSIYELKSSEVSGGDLPTELVEFETRRGVTLKYVLVKPPNPSAIVILLPGGSGTLNISGTTSDFVIGSSDGFMVRNRISIAESGFLTALIDVPSDMGADGMTTGFRISRDHADDIRDVVSRLKGENGLPVWLIGISAASYSATNVAIQLGEEFYGLILSSASTSPSVSDTDSFPYLNGILDMELDSIVVPTLITAHEDDECPGTPPTGAPLIQDKLIKAARVEVKYFTGGNDPLSGVCGPLAPHSFYGIDAEVVAAFAEYIVSNTLIPNIKANGSDSPVELREVENLDVTLDLNPGIHSGENADWWIAADTSFGWYSLDASTMLWLYVDDSYTEFPVTYQGVLSELRSYSILNTSDLLTGTYTIYFAIDTNMNDSLDFNELFYDSTVINIMP